MMEDVVILKIELNRMRTCIQSALLDRSREISKIVDDQVDKLCSGEKLKNIIEKQIDDQIISIISHEIESFFKYGEGRQAITELVQKQLRAGLNNEPN